MSGDTGSDTGAAVSIEPASVAHAELISALISLCLEPGWAAESVASFLAVPGSFALLASLGAAPGHENVTCGFVLCRCAGESADVAAMGVVPQARRRGVATALLAAAQAEAKRRGVSEMFLEVAETNAPARALYAQAGFVEVGRRARYYQNAARATDALVLRASL